MSDLSHENECLLTLHCHESISITEQEPFVAETAEACHKIYHKVEE